MTLDDLPAVLSVQQVQRVLNVGRNQTYQLLASGQLRHARVGRVIRVTKNALLEFLGELDAKEVQRP